MTAATAAPVHVTVGNSGRKVHRAYLAHNGQASTVCGAERRGVGVTYTRRTDAAVNCLACAPSTAAPAETPAAPAAKVSAAETARDEVTVTVPADDTVRFSAVRIAGRWKVQDAATGETMTCASRTKAEERAAKLNAAEERAGTTLQERSMAPLEVVTLDGTETTVTVEETPADDREARAAELAELVNAGKLSFDAAAAELLGGKAEAYEAPKEPMKSLWVAAAFVPIILADAAPERATLVAKLDASVPNNRGGRTVRLTRAEAEELAAIGTEIENEAGGVGRNAHSARTMRARLAALWA